MLMPASSEKNKRIVMSMEVVINEVKFQNCVVGYATEQNGSVCTYS